MDSAPSTIIPDAYGRYYREYVDLTFQWFSGVVGLFVMSANVVLLSVVLLNKRFRSQKEYVVLGANMLFDALYGCSFLLNALWALKLYYFEGEYIELYTPYQCSTMVQSLLMLLTMPGSGTVILAATVDRLFSVTFPFAYSRMSRLYALAIMLAGYAMPLPTLLLTVIKAQNTEKTLTKDCFIVTWMETDVLTADQYLGVSSTLVAVLFYAPIVYRVYRLYKHKSAHIQLGQRERQRILRTTMTVVLIMVSHVGMLVVPDTMMSFASPSLFVVAVYVRAAKGAVDVFIYLLMQRDLRRALFSGIWRQSLTSETTKVHSFQGK
ncbi:Protein Y40B10A.5, partial [Aphelenchoides avenae]